MTMLAQGISLGWALSRSLFGVGLLMVVAIGCGDDDNDTGDTEDITKGSGGSAASSAGDSDGSAGEAAGAAGDSAGSGGDSATSPEDQKKQDVCQCYIDLGVIPEDDGLLAECMSNVSDACVTCVQGIAGDANCSGMDDSDFNPCANDCLGMIAPPESSEKCKNLIEIFGESTVDVSVTDCFCDNCLDDFGSCIVNPGCQAIVLCVGERNLDMAAITTDEVCGPIFEEVSTVYPDALVGLALPVSVCNATYQCRPEPSAGDAGVDAGGAGE
jgi:hypothetical protein